MTHFCIVLVRAPNSHRYAYKISSLYLQPFLRHVWGPKFDSRSRNPAPAIYEPPLHFLVSAPIPLYARKIASVLVSIASAVLGYEGVPKFKSGLRDLVADPLGRTDAYFWLGPPAVYMHTISGVYLQPFRKHDVVV